MLPTTIDAVKAILRADPTVTPADRVAIIACIRNHGKVPTARQAVALGENRILHVGEVARRLGTSKRGIHRLTRAGVLHKVTMPGRKRSCGFLLHDVETLFSTIGSRNSATEENAAGGGKSAEM